MSVVQHNPNRPAATLRILIISDLQAVPQRVAQLSQWIHSHKLSFSIDVIVVIGVSRPAPNCTTLHEALANQGNDSVTLAQLEHICSRVIYVPGLHEHYTAWEPKQGEPLRLTNHSHNAISGPVVVAPDLVVVHRRYVDGITEKPTTNLPNSWRHTLYRKLSPPPRFRRAYRPSAIVLCTSQIPDAHASKSKSLSLLRTVASLLSLARSSIPELDYILAVAPPKMQRLPNKSSIFQDAERTLDPGSFADGDFCIAHLVRPDIWDPLKEPEVDEEQLPFESAWWVDTINRYNLDRPIGSDDDDDDDNDNSDDDEDDNEDRDNGDEENSDDDYDDEDDSYDLLGENVYRNGGFDNVDDEFSDASDDDIGATSPDSTSYGLSRMSVDDMSQQSRRGGSPEA